MIICALPANYSTKISGWKEYRLDFLDNLQKLQQQPDEQTILTVRAVTEGGKNDFPKQQKHKLYHKMIKKHNCLVDWEIQRYHTELYLPPANLILSYHNFSEFHPQTVAQIIEKSNQTPSKFVKLALPVNNYNQLNQIKKLIANSNKPVIWAGLGKLGKLSRILYKFLGATATFCGLTSQPTAPTQLTYQEVQKFRLDKITTQTAIGGIIGGSQVEHSLGLEFYNNYFSQNNFDAIYAPFSAEDFTDFWEWLHSSNSINFYGFSVTMPFKQKIAAKIGKKEPINLFLPCSNTSANTDITAFQKALSYFKIDQDDKILLWGYGGAAESFVLAAKNFQQKIYVDGRNKQKLQAFILKHNLHKATNSTKFQLLVNCTPVGATTLPVQPAKLPDFTKLLDLPYRNKPTELIKFCQKNSLAFISGQKFWQWQAEEQLHAFVKELKGNL